MSTDAENEQVQDEEMDDEDKKFGVQLEAVAAFCVTAGHLPAPVGREDGTRHSEEYQVGYKAALDELGNEAAYWFWAVGQCPEKVREKFPEEVDALEAKWTHEMMEFFSDKKDDSSVGSPMAEASGLGPEG